MAEMPRIKIYTCQRMTNRYCDEMVMEANMLVRALTNYGFEVLNPVVAENIPYEHVILEQVNAGRLEYFWSRDKAMIKEADIVLDYNTCNQSDGSNVEVGYARWCCWKPTVRVWPGVKINVSKIEYDYVCDSLMEAIAYMVATWGTYEQLGTWRRAKLERSMPGWIAEFRKMNQRYGLTGMELI